MTEKEIQHSCPNCGSEYPADFRYCPHCGQKNEASVLSFREMVLDLLSAFFSFDTKAIRSIPKLLFKPGSLTAEYMRGRRQTYLAPFRLYLFVSIVLFLLLPLILNEDAMFRTAPPNNGGAVTDSAAIETVSVDEVLQQIEQELKENAGPVDSAAIAEALPDSLLEEDATRFKTGVNFNVDRSGTKPNISLVNFEDDDTASASKWQLALEMVEEGASVEAAVDSLFPGNSRATGFVLQQGLKLQSRGGKGLMSSFLDVTSYTLFIFLPVFALCLKLLYIRRKRYYIEHLIFSLHYFSFFFMLLIIFLLLYKFVYHVPFWIFFSISLVYLLLAMLRFYGQNWMKTSLKWMILLFTTSSIFLPVFFIIALGISLFFY